MTQIIKYLKSIPFAAYSDLAYPQKLESPLVMNFHIGVIFHELGYKYGQGNNLPNPSFYIKDLNAHLQAVMAACLRYKRIFRLSGHVED